jgi:hypothetical protein
MKHEFVLDENILYLAIKGTDERGERDTTSTRLLLLILKNCHKIVVDAELNRRYRKLIRTLERISRAEPVIPEMENFVRNLLQNKDKVMWHFSSLAPVPDEEKIPRKDIHVVRTGYHFEAKIITVDKELAEGIYSLASSGERVVVLHPRDAITLAEET